MQVHCYAIDKVAVYDVVPVQLFRIYESAMAHESTQ